MDASGNPRDVVRGEGNCGHVHWSRGSSCQLVREVMKQHVDGGSLAPYNTLKPNWDLIKCGFPAQECKAKWESLVNKVRHYRTVHEVAMDIMMVNAQCSQKSVYRANMTTKTHKVKELNEAKATNRIDEVHWTQMLHGTEDIHGIRREKSAHRKRETDGSQERNRTKELTETKETNGMKKTRTTKKVLGTKIFQCPDCEFSSIRKPSFNRHCRRHNPESKLKCDSCEMSFLEKFFLKQHIEIKHQGKRLLCNACGQLFVSNCALYEHKKKYHLKSMFKHVCEVCDKRFISLKNYNGHVNRSCKKPKICYFKQESNKESVH